MGNMRRGIPRIFKDGYRQFSGVEEAVLKNIEAVKQLCEIVRTSFGPNGMNKMVINHIDKLYVTADAGTIISQLEIAHPAARVVKLAAGMQEQEVGDGSNFVIMFAGELLKKAGELIHMGLHPADIVAGYTMAARKAQELLGELSIYKEENLTDPEKMAYAIKTAIAAKQYGLEDSLAKVTAEACILAMPKNPFNFNVMSVRTEPVPGGRVEDAYVIKGLVGDHRVKSTVRECSDAKVLVLNCTLDAPQTETKSTVMLKSADELLNYTKTEEENIEKIVKSIVDSGVKLVICLEKIGDLAIHYINKYKLMCFRVTSKWTMRRMCRLMGARPCVSVHDFRPDDLGYCSKVYMKEIGGSTITVFDTESEKAKLATIVTRGSTDQILQDVDRAIDDGINVCRNMTRDARFVAGAGAMELELARRIAKWGKTVTGLEQYSIQKYAESLEVVPRTLAENSGLNDTEIISKLYSAHESDAANATKIGVDIVNGGVDDMTAKGVVDLLATRAMGLRLASNSAITLLRVDHIIMAKQAGGPKKPKGRGHWDDND